MLLALVGAETGLSVGSVEESETGVAARSAGSIDDIADGVDVSGVLVVEDVEDFAYNFEVVAFTEVGVFGHACVDVVDARVAESITAYHGRTVIAS